MICHQGNNSKAGCIYASLVWNPSLLVNYPLVVVYAKPHFFGSNMDSHIHMDRSRTRLRRLCQVLRIYADEFVHAMNDLAGNFTETEDGWTKVVRREAKWLTLYIYAYILDMASYFS